jgi:hypothetical protein
VTDPEVLEFYATHGPTTDLGRHSALVATLPSDPEALGKIVRGLLLHNFMAAMRGLEFPPERMAHMRTIGAEAILDNVLELDASPLDMKRPAKRRMVGFCYHFALLHTALLRSQGVPARTRCGFAGYFEAGKWIDHWVTEYWDGERWRLNDPQIGRGDLTAEDFHDGVIAWQLTRAERLDAAAHGNGELWGWDELRGSLVNDVGALNKIDVAGWYWCERLKVDPLHQPNDELDATLDAVADDVLRGETVEGVMAAFEREPGLKPPPDVVAM